jgi:hypothetical protein
VDFISLDNASYDQFDDAQVAWLERVLARDETDANVRSLVVGMHDALPDSISTDHGMNESAQMERRDGAYIRICLRSAARRRNTFMCWRAIRTF